MIKADGLTMHYGPVVALDDVSFEVNRGEVVGLLGPNGAGKSTALKILTTYLYPTKGTALVADVDVLEDPVQVRTKFGYLPEVLPLYMDMEVRDYLNFVGRARGLRGGRLQERIQRVVDVCGLKPMFRKVIRELSKGYKQRTGLAQALIHDPEVVILDEPTSGLDPHQILEIRDLIGELAQEKTVILSTHILQEVEATADRIVIINRGKIVGDGTFRQLRERASDLERMEVSLVGAREEMEAKLRQINGVKQVDVSDEDNGCVSFTLYSQRDMDTWKDIGQLAQSNRWAIRRLTEKPLSLEETFLTLTEKAIQADS